MSDRITKNTIMIIDDEPVNIRYMAEMLDVEYTVLSFTSGSEALKFLEASPEIPDLILLDIVMPNIDGYEVCSIIKQNPETKHIPIIFMTSLLDDSDEEKGLAIGASDYIKKPFSKIIAKTRIENQLKLKQYHDYLIESANTDQLTRVYNRKYLDTMLDKELAILSRYKGYMSLLMIDVDNFKLYNDHYGHIAGDECLKTVAACIKSVLKRKNDFCARYGGEEFVVLLPGSDAEAAKKISDKILTNIQKASIKHEYSDASNNVTVSIGYTTANEKSMCSAKQILSSADDGLYISKKTGKNRATFQVL